MSGVSQAVSGGGIEAEKRQEHGSMTMMGSLLRRIFVDINWIHDVWLNITLPENAPLKDKAWFGFGRVLAVANLVYFSINLFGFLIPRFLPRAFKSYFQERGEVYAKAAEDKVHGVIDKSNVPHKESSNLRI
ncbi:uncharacterized protein [Cicer arietinum]|uniref:Uncharacterized protein LOC101511780 isoform X2 n=1 Tax=Cicer arietinum TaxID=3827 RepID=A0A1S3E9X9_CICAR|nr:uncharacterized protein LOC101511780 isoform X2 [Cicer arietinum]